jgi:phage tail-like protein
MDLSITAQQMDQLSLVVDRYNCYPGELLTFHLRFVVPGTPGAVVQFIIPRVMAIESYDLPEGIPDQVLSLIERDEELILTIPLRSHFIPGKVYDFKIRVRVNTFYFDHFLLIRSLLQEEGDKQTLASEALQVAVFSKGKYLRYLPEIYEEDNFIGRFLMLMESFWKPISQQIDQIDSYMDPNLTPEAFIPWLSSWVGLPVDSLLPIERVRAILKNAMIFNQCRGTRQALQTYMEIYTSGKVEIIEKRSSNFVLGQKSDLGVEIALGKENKPNSILIKIHVPAGELDRIQYSKDMYQRKMMSIVRNMVPAHTIFDVHCIFNEN